MRLTNINCPQCNGQLNQQEDKFYCTSCGSAFNIDYEESDVEYAKLITEPERTKLYLENNRILLEKNEELRRKFVIGEMKDKFKQEAKTAGVTYAGGAIYGVLIGIIAFVAVVAFIGVIFFITSKNITAERAKKEQAELERFENFSAEDVENDRNFLENAIASGTAYEISRRVEPVTRNADDEGDAYLVGKPVPVNCYFLKTDSECHLCIVYKITYEFSNNKAVKEVYDCVIFENIELDETGHVSFGHPCDRTCGRNCDDHWEGYENAEDVYEDKGALPDDADFYKVNI